MSDVLRRCVRLDELLEPAQWQRLQDRFTHVFGLGLRAVSPQHHLLSTPSWPAGVDGARLIEGLRLGEEIDALLPAEALPHDPATLTTPLGVSFSAIPLRAADAQVLGYLLIGPVVLGKREEPEAFRRRVAALGVDAESAWPLLLTVKVYTFLHFRSVIQLVEDVTGMWLELAGQARELQAIVAHTPQANPALAARYTERLLQSLLEVATSVTEAEGGSVMLYEPSSDAFRIAASRGLETKIVETAVKPQDSLAGLAVRTRQVLVVDDQVRDAQVRQRMRRRELASSMVAPLLSETASEPVGVLSVRTSQQANRFTADDAELLQKLAKLAQTALSSLSLLGRER